MRKSSKERFAFEAIMILLMLAIICLITRLWPLVLLVVLGTLVAALRLLFVSARKKPDEPQAIVLPAAQLKPENEQDIIRLAFGLLQRRISENVIQRYPSARWVWETPNPIERFSGEMQLAILLNRAGGYSRATVAVHNLQFCGLVYHTAENTAPEMLPGEDGTCDPVREDMQVYQHTVDYALIAFQWVEANLIDLNTLCNNAIAEGETTLFINDTSLPHRESWNDICRELTRNGFADAEATRHGIKLTITQ